jgi:hypothetical protein
MSIVSNMSGSVSHEEEEEETPQSKGGLKPHQAMPSTTGETIPASNLFIRQLDYPEDDDDASGILHMEEPSDEPSLFKSFLTPASGDPSNNPAYAQRLLNPDLYGTKINTKSLAMVNSKVQWNGKWSIFDSFVKHGFESNNNPDTPKCISIIKLPNDKWQAECRQDSEKDDDEEKNDTVNIGINRKTWEILSSAPFMQRLFSQYIYGINVHFVDKGTEGLSSRFKSFGLLLDENDEPVAPGTNYLAKDIFVKAGLSNSA